MMINLLYIVREGLNIVIIIVEKILIVCPNRWCPNRSCSDSSSSIPFLAGGTGPTTGPGMKGREGDTPSAVLLRGGKGETPL